MEVYDENMFPITQREFSDVVERAILERFSGGKPPDHQFSLKKVDTFVCANASLSRTYI